MIFRFASVGCLAGSPADPAQFSFYAQYNKSTSNPQGGVEIIVHSYNNPDGSTDTKLHHYRLKSTSISVLAVNTAITASHPYATAQFSSKANVAELVNGVEVTKIIPVRLVPKTMGRPRAILRPAASLPF